jgi:hypothetical protein
MHNSANPLMAYSLPNYLVPKRIGLPRFLSGAVKKQDEVKTGHNI